MKAKKIFLAAALLSMGFTETSKKEAWDYLSTGKYNEAILCFDKLEKHDYESLFGKAFAYFLKKDYEKAAVYFQNCLHLNPNCAACEYMLGIIKTAEGEKKGAVEHYKNALKLDYNLPEAHVKLAELYHEMNMYDQAFEKWAKVLNIDSKNPRAKAKKQKLLAFISKKPEEIVEHGVIEKASVIAHASDREKIPVLRVCLIKETEEINLWSEKGLAVKNEGGSVCFETFGSEIFTINASSEPFRKDSKFVVEPKSENRGIILKDVEYASGFAWAGYSDREYRGTLEIIIKKGGISVINSVNLEEYLYSVLPSEMISWWPEEALKAQSVIARSSAIFRKNAGYHKKDGYDLCSFQHCQVYSGIKQESSKVRKIVDSTRGEVLKYKGNVINAIFSSNCSGHTQSSCELEGWGKVGYFTGVFDGEGDFPENSGEFDRWIKHPPDIYCAPSKNTYYAESRWIRVLSQEDLSGWLDRIYGAGRIKKIITVKRSKSGHINHLKVTGTKRTVDIIKENKIRSMVFGKLRSTNFIVESYGNYPGIPEYFIFWGAGWGHAVGLCQSGAAGMAEKGYGYRDILKHYYKGTAFEKIFY